jgi:hypothetical protein
MRIAIDLSDVEMVTSLVDNTEGFVAVLTGASGKAVFEAWKQKMRQDSNQPQLQL